MLLADLDVDIIRIIVPGSEGQANADPGGVAWDKSKRILEARTEEIDGLLVEADVFLTDHPHPLLEAYGLDTTAAQGRHSGLIHAWMPPFVPNGSIAETAEDPLLLNVWEASRHIRLQARDRRSRRSFLPRHTSMEPSERRQRQLSWLARQRDGLERTVMVSGMHAAAAQPTSLLISALVEEILSGERNTEKPNWRIYQGSDGGYFFLAALTSELSIRALDAIGRIALLVSPEIEDGLSRLVTNAAAKDAMARELAETFNTELAEHCVEIINAAKVPCAPVSQRTHWLDSDVVRTTTGVLSLNHPQLGEVLTPGPAISLTRTPTQIPSKPWERREAGAKPAAADFAEPRIPLPRTTSRGIDLGSGLPLDGMEVVDASAFFAGPSFRRCSPNMGPGLGFSSVAVDQGTAPVAFT